MTRLLLSLPRWVYENALRRYWLAMIVSLVVAAVTVATPGLFDRRPAVAVSAASPTPTAPATPTLTPEPARQPTDTPLRSTATSTIVAFESDSVGEVIASLNRRGILKTSEGSVSWGIKDFPLEETQTGKVSSSSSGIQASDFVVYADFTWNSPDSEDTACGFVFRNNNQGSYYMALLRKNGGAVLWLSIDDNWQPSPVETYANSVRSKNGATNKMILVAQGNTFTFLVNDSSVYRATDNTLATGDVGLVVGTGTASNTCAFREAWVWGSDSSPGSVPTEKPASTRTPIPPTRPAVATRTPIPPPTTTPEPIVQPTIELPLDARVTIINRLSVGISINLAGPYTLSYYLAAGETQVVYMPSGTYFYTATAVGYAPLTGTKTWSGGEWEWEFYSGP